ncbi:MAG TPA: sulfate adenylyltransferase [Planctomycetota bacterium]|jgi:sulfate adenylyltransferase|nr:sulfate adenylyltransferase [Planctomycetota bacterium]
MPITSTSKPVPVHGGLETPVDRIVPRTEIDTGRWSTLPRVDVNETDRTTLYRIADGTLSPLVGPMGKALYRSVIESASIESGGRRYAWTIPIVLPVTDAEAAVARSRSELALVHGGTIFGRLQVDDVFAWNKVEFVETVYGTKRTDHPGAKLWLGDPRTKLVGGSIQLVPFEDKRPFAARVLGPKATRALFAKRGFEQTVAFQTRNPLHRAHEYALVYGAEKLLRDTGKRTGVVLNPLVGQLKGDDVPADVRMRTYEALVEGRFLGKGDMDEALWKQKSQDLNDQLELIGLDMRMYYGGPREAVMHSIYRQNLGFSHFIVGRKHADAPYDDKTPIWGDFDAQEIFGKLGGELAIKTVNVGFAAYFEEIGRVGLVEENKGKTQVTISGTRMRELLDKGEMPDERVMRPSTAKVLADHYRSQVKA